MRWSARCYATLRWSFAERVLEAMMSPVSLAVTAAISDGKGASDAAIFSKIAAASMRAGLNGHKGTRERLCPGSRVP